jgi:hypothetical protein
MCTAWQKYAAVSNVPAKKQGRSLLTGPEELREYSAKL